MHCLTASDCIKRISGGAFIPNDPGNRDCREHVDWLAAGNTAEQKLEAAGLSVAELRELIELTAP